jgi:hypothetical protein
MSSLSSSDIVYMAVGVLAAVWGVGLALYVTISDARSRASAWASTIDSFSSRLSSLGKRLRESKTAPPA